MLHPQIGFSCRSWNCTSIHTHTGMCTVNRFFVISLGGVDVKGCHFIHCPGDEPLPSHCCSLITGLYSCCQTLGLLVCTQSHVQSQGPLSQSCMSLWYMWVPLSIMVLPLQGGVRVRREVLRLKSGGDWR